MSVPWQDPDLMTSRSVTSEAKSANEGESWNCHDLPGDSNSYETPSRGAPFPSRHKMEAGNPLENRSTILPKKHEGHGCPLARHGTSWTEGNGKSRRSEAGNEPIRLSRSLILLENGSRGSSSESTAIDTIALACP